MRHMLGLDDRILFRTRGKSMLGTAGLFFPFWDSLLPIKLSIL